MLVLRSSPASPFGRKIKIAAAVLGLSDHISVENADTTNASDSLRSQNPLGKIPALILEDGSVLYDSRVITEYLDYMAGGEKLLPAGAERFEVLTQQALADGIMDAALQIVYEGRFRAEDKQLPEWVAYQQEKIDRALGSFDTKPLHYVAHNSPNAAQIALACALGYLDLRLEGKWRENHTNVVAWLDDFSSAVPSFEATRMKV
ncbi:glutathione S-transferase family protein [Rhodobacteraceae bacterium RKSG542]|uniref:glutathione S-transferase n=1 Tax=Pseudovibrio flavus TaxID=2529854 RepID=UPI0012BC1574|nr:glutathione S-transferase N-terminal domain-containing protein [Pseudovibrio flavus]MTI19046.1 glutathione S-transferase family protein [Pseudovibrio flavus]